jgi:hypothetical protein
LVASLKKPRSSVSSKISKVSKISRFSAKLSVNSRGSRGHNSKRISAKRRLELIDKHE